MKKSDWLSLLISIPKKVKIGRKTFKIVWVDKFKDKKQVGETDYENKTITLKTSDDAKETVHTYFHELLHAFSDEFEIQLTEKQVQKLEKTLKYWIRSGNIFTRGL